MLTPDELDSLAKTDPQAFADAIRPQWPEKAAEIDAALERNPDQLKLDVQISMKLEKFDGDWEPGKRPVEIIETHS